MSIPYQDILVLSDQIVMERGAGAAQFVDHQVNRLRLEGDQKSAVLWSMVLAQLYRKAQT